MGRTAAYASSLALLAVGFAASCRDFQHRTSDEGQGGEPRGNADGGTPSGSGGEGPKIGGASGTDSVTPFQPGAGGRGADGAGEELGGAVSAPSGGADLGGGGAEPGGGSAPPDAGLHPLGALPDLPEELAARRVAPPSPGSLPASVDLTDRMPPPGDQGSQSSSVAWAAAYAIKTYQEGLQAKWSVNSDRYQYSPAWVYNQLSGDVDGGVRPSAALALLVEKGADTLKFFPYRDDSFRLQPDTASMARGARFPAARWGTLDVDVTTLKKALAANQPVLLTFEVFPDFDTLSAANPTYDEARDESRGRHAVTLTGYDDGRSAFRFMNSWGTGWGLGGHGFLDYALMSRDSLGAVAYLLSDAKNAPPASQASLFVVENGHVWRADKDFGDYASLSNANWTGSSAAALLGGCLYVAQGDKLHQVNTGDGSFTILGAANWSGTTAMTTLGARLYATQGDELWRVDSLASGARTRVGDANWNGASAMTSLNDALYVIHSGRLYRVDAATGAKTPVGEAEWYGAARMVALRSALFIAHGAGLWQVHDLETGAYHRVGGDDWSEASSITGSNEHLYLIQAERLWQVDPSTGVRQALGGAAAWRGPTLLNALP